MDFSCLVFKLLLKKCLMQKEKYFIFIFDTVKLKYLIHCIVYFFIYNLKTIKKYFQFLNKLFKIKCTIHRTYTNWNWKSYELVFRDGKERMASKMYTKIVVSPALRNQQYLIKYKSGTNLLLLHTHNYLYLNLIIPLISNQIFTRQKSVLFMSPTLRCF